MRPFERIKPLYSMPAEDLLSQSLLQEDAEDDHRILRLSIENRRIIAPCGFNPAFSDSLACKRTRKHPVKQKTPLAWDLPGHESQGRGCGASHSVIACENADYFKRIKNHCWRFSCPICAWDTSTRKASEICQRIMAYDHLRPRSYLFNVKHCWQHVVISPPQAQAKKLMGSSEGYAHLRAVAGEIIKDLGAVAGVLVFHPFRQNGEDDFNNRLATGNTGNINDWRTAPHFHAIVCGFIDPQAVRELYRSSKWIVKSIRSHLDEKQIIGVANYLLTHVGVGTISGRRSPQTYQYFGELTTAHLQISADLERAEMPICPNCSGALIRVSLSPFSRMPTGYDSYVHISEGRVYCLKEDRDEVDRLLSSISPGYLPGVVHFHTGLFFPTFADTDELWVRGRKAPRVPGDDKGVQSPVDPWATMRRNLLHEYGDGPDEDGDPPAVRLG